MFLISYLIKRKMLEGLPSRQEGHTFLKYLDLEDFPGLKCTKFEFYSKKNKLVGYRYFYQDSDYKGLITVHHGYGGGHKAYITQIASLAKQGYIVYAYDNSCCCESEGEHFFSFSSSIVDQKYYYKWLDEDEAAKGLRRFSFGHSWGGYTSLCSLWKKSYKVEKAVGLSAFDNVVSLTVQHYPPLKKVSFLLRVMQFRYFGRIGNLSVSSIIKKTDKKALIVFGNHDETVNFEENFLKFKEVAKDNKNVEFLVAEGRFHQPYNTQIAQDYYYELCAINDRNEPMPEVDYKKLTEEDPYIMGKIYEFLEK